MEMTGALCAGVAEGLERGWAGMGGGREEEGGERRCKRSTTGPPRAMVGAGPASPAARRGHRRQRFGRGYRMAQSALIAAFMAGLLGGLHCLAMCGGYVGAFAARPAAQTVEILQRRSLLVGQTIANVARITAYAVLGAFFGAAGGTALASEWVGLQRGLYVFANLLLLVLAAAIATGRSPFGAVERLGLALYRRALPAAASMGRRPGLPGRAALGFLWGLTPCGLVYGVLPVAMLSGGALDGALVMLAFGLGTLPNLLAAGMLTGGARRRFAAPAWRYAAGALVAAFAFAGLYRALYVPGALAHGPFCIVP